MSNHPMLNYKPGLTLDEPITVTMAAADWIAFMTWFSGDINTDGVHHIVYGVISPQVVDKIYATDSVKAAEAHLHEQAEQIGKAFTFRFPVVSAYPPELLDDDEDDD